ncbi:FIMAH domain-containing protein [Sporosarcina sp. NPDC096371]|uniref:FIMAH domain-containing protein n=1 Tax=Sporosarcina sp. NPDC096371 TaxID=3364530 RepID=UPI003806B2B5
MHRNTFKKITQLFLLFTLIMSPFYGVIQNVSASTLTDKIYEQFFVSTTGSDDNDGTYEHPFLTIEKAREAVRQINKDMTGDIYVFVAEGDYYIPEGMKFNEGDSGFNGHRVHYKSLGAPGSARLIGGVPIKAMTTDWKKASADDADTSDYLSYLPESAVDQVYKVKLDPKKYNFNQLYIGNQADTSFNKAIMARTPNKIEDARFQAWNGPYILSTKGSNKDMGYKSNDLTPAQIEALVKAQAANVAEIAQLFVFDAGGYAFESNTLPINRIDTANNMMYSPFNPDHPEMYITKYNINADARYFMQGNISFLDEAGEYHYDKETGWLYYYPTADDGIASVEDMNNLNVVVPTTKEIIRLQGSDKSEIKDWGNEPDLAKQVSHITFDGFTLEATESDHYIVDGWSYGETWYAGGTAIPYPPPEAEGSTQPYYSDYAVRPAYMHGGFTLINTNNITIQNSRITNMGLFGIVVWRDNSHNTFQNLEISNTGMGGINSDGGYPGVGKYNNNHTFYNLSIHHVGQVNAFGAGLQVMNTGHSNFKNLEIYYAPRRAISFVGQAQTMPNASPNFDPVRDVYNYGNRFEYIYVHDSEQDTAEDSAIFIGALFKGGDVQRMHGTRIPAEAINKETGEAYGELKAGNVFNQIVTSEIGSAPDVRDPNTVHGMDLAMGATGTYLSNIEGINNQSANLRIEPTQNGDVFFVDNVNSDFPTSAYNPRLYYSFDNSKMEYDKIGINRQDFPFTSELYNPISPKLQANSYFSDDFEGGEIDTTKWSIEKGNPVISTAYTAEGPFNGHYSLSINGGAKGNLDGVAISRTFDDSLNKIVTGWFFDKRRDYAGNDYWEGLNDSDVRGQSYMRVDNNTSDNLVGLGINGHASRDYFTYLDGATEKLTDIHRSFGWHQFKYDYSTPGKVTLYINDQEVTTLDRASFNYIGMGNYDSSGQPGKNTGMSYFDLIDVYGGADADPVEPLQPGSGTVPPYEQPEIVDPVTLIEGWDFENGMPTTEKAITNTGQSTDYNKNGFTTFWGSDPNLKVIDNPKKDDKNDSEKVMIVNNEPSLYYEETPEHEWSNYTLDLKFALDSDYTSTAQPLRFFVNTQPIVESGTHAGKMTYQPAGYNVAFNKNNNKMELYRADLNSAATNSHTLIEGSTTVDLPDNLFKAVGNGGSWHTLSITVVDGTISATLDETITISGQDATYASGYFAFVPYDGNNAKFNLAIDDISIKTNSSITNMVYDANLKLGNATLNGEFNPSHTTYQATIVDPDKDVTLIKPTSEHGATFAILLNGTDITNEFVDMTAQSLPLIFGSNTLTIVQTSAVGAKINYTVGIYKSHATATIDAVSPVSTTVGISPKLPKMVNVTFDGKTTQSMAIKWDMMNNTDLGTPGTYTVNGSLVGMYGKVSITVHINGVTSIGSLEPISMLTTELPVLPTSVLAETMKDGVLGSTTLPITFVEVDPSVYTKVGTVVLVAHVNGRSERLLQKIFVSDAAEVPEEPQLVETAAELKILVEQLAAEGALDKTTARSLILHLTAVSRYEEQELTEKVIKHMEGFRLLIDHHRDNELLSGEVYSVLKANADSLIKKWQ